MKTERWMLLRNMKASFEGLRIELQQLDQRKRLYQEQLLPQMHQQTEASLTAYTNGAGDFSEVVRARIAELNAKIDNVNIQVSRQKIIAQLNYFFISDNETHDDTPNKKILAGETL